MYLKFASATLVSLCLGLSACNSSGDSSPPPSAPGTTPPPPPPPPPDTTAPTVPGNVKAAAQSASSIKVTWDASTDDSGISGYRVFRDNGSAAVATVQTTSYTDDNLSASTAYSYTIEAVDN